MGLVKSITHAYAYNEYLYWHIEQKDIPNIEKILQLKPQLVNQNLTVNYKTTPLHRAAVNGNLQIAQLLVQKYKAEVNHPTSTQETPLMGAAKRDQIELVRYLLTMGADSDLVSGNGFRAIDYAILAGFYEVALLLFQKMKDKQLRQIEDYQIIAKKFQYRYVNYKVFLDSLLAQVDPENVPNFLKKQKKLFEDPVVDPRQTWKQWFLRTLDFKDPPLVQRSQLPEELQPQNRRFGKVRHFLSRIAMTHMTQKPSYLPQHHSEAASNDVIEIKTGALSQKLEVEEVRSYN